MTIICITKHRCIHLTAKLNSGTKTSNTRKLDKQHSFVAVLQDDKASFIAITVLKISRRISVIFIIIQIFCTIFHILTGQNDSIFFSSGIKSAYSEKCMYQIDCGLTKNFYICII